jgi:Fe2+ or Zn2+ uptake regulation protein
MDTAKRLRGLGQKVTPQRMSILCSVRHSDHHVSANEIHDDVQRIYPFVDVSTVYRTLNTAKDLGLVVEVDLGKGDLEFEWRGEERHYHLLCRVCGAESVVNGEPIARLVGAISREHGFTADLEHMAIQGTCRDCALASKES